VHFEKGLPECKGIYRAINAETAKLLSSDYTYINRESDMGVEGIREAKMRYHPDHMVEVNFIKREEIEKIFEKLLVIRGVLILIFMQLGDEFLQN